MTTISVRKAVDGWLPIELLNAGSPVTGKVYGDVTCTVAAPGDGTPAAYTVGSSAWVEIGAGLYWLLIGADEFTATGPHVVRVAVSGADDAVVIAMVDETLHRVHQESLGKIRHDQPNLTRTVYDTDGTTELATLTLSSSDEGRVITETPS